MDEHNKEDNAEESEVLEEVVLSAIKAAGHALDDDINNTNVVKEIEAALIDGKVMHDKADVIGSIERLAYASFLGKAFDVPVEIFTDLYNTYRTSTFKAKKMSNDMYMYAAVDYTRMLLENGFDLEKTEIKMREYLYDLMNMKEKIERECKDALGAVLAVREAADDGAIRAAFLRKHVESYFVGKFRDSLSFKIPAKIFEDILNHIHKVDEDAKDNEVEIPDDIASLQILAIMFTMINLFGIETDLRKELGRVTREAFEEYIGESVPEGDEDESNSVMFSRLNKKSIKFLDNLFKEKE